MIDKLTILIFEKVASAGINCVESFYVKMSNYWKKIIIKDKTALYFTHEYEKKRRRHVPFVS